MNKIAMLGLSGALSMAAAPAAMASYDGYEWARVTHVQPIVRTVTVQSPQQECWGEEVTRMQTRSSTSAQLAGALIGGVIGSQIGSGSGRRAATATGVLLGAQVGHNRTKVSTPVTGYEQYCSVRTVYHEEQRVEGYRVTYNYRGQSYVTQTQQHPGNRIRVQVSVRPASFW